ncbi:MAG TPA: D-alanine--D-alanine ligase family protein [Actinomycetota bacterium]|jgi:D-alanine-D-alanine ligase|nr:D-alanine--D-alanine ligase family protein [Actinomycetota bacterium]
MRVLVLFGGRSGEHEVSVVSARAVLDAVRSLGHEGVPVGITRDGAWVRCDPAEIDRVPPGGEPFDLVPDPTRDHGVDVAWPVMHGPYGEDGCVQGLFELADVPYVGAGVQGSAAGMDKVTQKVMFRAAGLPVVDHVAFRDTQWRRDRDGVRGQIAALGLPVFVKPSRLGSSVGISKVAQPGELDDAVARALTHDALVIVEAAGGPRELEIGLIESGSELMASVVGEVVPDGEFYDYRAKYRGTWTQISIPADIPSPVADRIADLAARAFRTIDCAGMARVDFFWDPASERLLLNEINTLPGITPSSMFPMLWEATGRPFTEVVALLLDHALERHLRKQELEAARAAAHDDEVGV